MEGNVMVVFTLIESTYGKGKILLLITPSLELNIMIIDH